MNAKKLYVCLGVLAGAALAVLGAHGGGHIVAAQNSTAQESKVPPRITEAIVETNRVALLGNVHPLARSEFDQGAVPDSQAVTRALVVLRRSPEQESALRQLLDDQQNKTSPNFHAWLTPEQFGKQFGPADTDIQAVTDWLTFHGFQNIKVGPGRTAIEFSGNSAQVRNAFQTQIHRYVIGERQHFANASDPQIPEALGPVMKGIVGLNNFAPRPQFHRLGTFRRTNATGEVRRLFTFTPPGSTSPIFAVGPEDLATIYNLPPTVGGNPAGAGVSIAVVEDSNINLQDYTDFRNLFGLPSTAPALQVILNGPDPGLNADEVEADLDAQWAGAVAPNAQIIMVVTENPQTGVGASGVDLSALYAIDNNLAPVLSESFGFCEAQLGIAGNAFENALFEQAAAQGITVTVAAGDTGSAGCDPITANIDVAAGGLAVSGNASTPFDVAVGGTDFNSHLTNYQQTYWNTTNASGTQASAKSYIPEITWNDSCAAAGSTTGCTAAIISSDANTGVDIAAGSGGPSNCATQTNTGACSAGYPKPSWQTGLGVPADGVRDIPDVSLFAGNGNNNSFYILCQRDANNGTGSNTNSCDLNSPFNDFQGAGGTSFSSPIFAAVMALVNQRLGRQGLASPTLYAMASQTGATCTSAANPASTCIFYDIPAGAGNNSVACQGGTLDCSNTSTAANQYGIEVLCTPGATGCTVNNSTTPAFNTTANYDLATGLGSINVTNLVMNWAPPVRAASTTTLTSVSPSSITVDSPVTVTGTVTPNTATGIVALYQGNTTTGPAIATFAVSSGNYGGSTNNAGVTTFLPGGSYNVIAHYGGDANNSPSDSAPIAVTVGKQNSQTVMEFVTASGQITTAAQNIAYGSNYILRIDVENASGQTCQNQSTGALVFPCPTGQLTLSDNGGPLNDFPKAQNANATNIALLNNEGFAEDQPVQLPAGSHSITASYAGDNSYNAGNSNALSVIVSKATTSALVASSATTVASGGSVTLTATLSTQSNGEPPCGSGTAGTVQFMNGSSAISGTVTYTGTSGAQSATGIASCTAALTTTLAQVVPLSEPKIMPMLRLWTPIAAWLAAAAMLFLTLRRACSRKLAYAVVGLAVLASVSAGTAGCGGGSSGSTTGGAHTDNITAVYSGDTNYSGSTSAALAVTVQ